MRDRIYGYEATEDAVSSTILINCTRSGPVSTEGGFVGDVQEGETMRERLAEHVHIVWQRWMSYMFSHFDEEHMDRWRRQANTKYEDLPEHEKESDRAIAGEYLALLREGIVEWIVESRCKDGMSHYCPKCNCQIHGGT